MESALDDVIIMLAQARKRGLSWKQTDETYGNSIASLFSLNDIVSMNFTQTAQTDYHSQELKKILSVIVTNPSAKGGRFYNVTDV